jgi:kelch-like protein 20
MGTKRLGVAVAVLDGYLYAIGGSDGQSPLNTGELSEMNGVLRTKKG